MLAYIVADDRGTADALLSDLADDLAQRGVAVAGAVKVPERCRGSCDMALRVLGSGTVVRISQDLGPGAAGCRLDPGALEGVARSALIALEDPRTALVIVNKFGHQEARLGRGFRALIAGAVDRGLPVLTSVAPAHLEAFMDFAGQFARPVEGNMAALQAWTDMVLRTAPSDEFEPLS